MILLRPVQRSMLYECICLLRLDSNLSAQQSIRSFVAAKANKRKDRKRESRVFTSPFKNLGGKMFPCCVSLTARAVGVSVLTL